MLTARKNEESLLVEHLEKKMITGVRVRYPVDNNERKGRVPE